ncbi:MmcQ/YjbR family DNA-binding protein [Leptolyngbya ohadii]|uniref:MmcQ/YjbR family DNA-binding protein n=1 Tax=Leptolyngbya ohadii TaxID=1962290 RepID=UPI000B59AEEB|nr:MmcQ/YjbR family DNA-binding protein [Leptolyngbya ohadii]
MTRDEFNEFCSGLLATSHVVQWGGSDVWKVGGKVFAICGGSDNGLPGITFKTSQGAYEMLREMPRLRPAPYLTSRGLKWIQRYDHPGLTDDELRYYLAESHQMVASGFSQKKRLELGL